MEDLRDALLDEYKKIADNLKELNDVIISLNAQTVPQLGDEMRETELQFGLVYTLFKTAVYNMMQGDKPRTGQ
jgi:hypothetical protein